MVNRLVSVGDDFTLPTAVKVADTNLPARLGTTALNATYANVGSSRRTVPLTVAEKVVTSFQAGHGWAAGATGAGTNLNDTTTFSSGTQSAKVVTDGAGTGATLTKSGLGLDLRNMSLRVKFRIDDYTKLGGSGLVVYAGDAALTNCYYWTFLGAESSVGFQYTLGGEWAYITLTLSSASVTGSPNLAAIDTIRVRSQDAAAGPVTVWWNEVATVRNSARHPKGAVTICWDDCDASTMDAAAIMDPYGFPATMFAITEVIGTPGYLTLDQAKSLEAQHGWEVGAHSYTLASHTTGYPAMTDAAALDDMRKNRSWLESNGFRGADVFAWPHGYYDAAKLALARQVYPNARGTVRRTRHETFPPADPYRIRTLEVFNTDTLASIQTEVDRAYANGTWLVLTFHILRTPATAQTSWTSADYAALMAYIAAKGIPVRTMGDALNSDARALGKGAPISTEKAEVIGGGFVNGYDTALWIAPAPRASPTNNSQGLYVQHRVSGDLGGLVHDGAASEIRLSGATNTGVGQSAHEASLVVTGGANTIGDMTGVLSNFHTEGTPTGSASKVALFRATQIPPLAAGFTVGTAYGMYVENQIVGANNYTIWAPDGISAIGPLVAKNTSTATLTARAITSQTASILNVQNATPTTLFRVDPNGTGGFGGNLSGVTFYVTNNLATAGTIAMAVRGVSGQTADLQQWQDNTGAVLAKVTASGAIKANAMAAGSRPSASTAGVGAQVYDTTLSKPIWSDGTVWRDAMGTAV